MKKFNLNLLINRLDLFTLIDSINSTESSVEEDGSVNYMDPIDISLSIQSDDHCILVKSNDIRLYDYLNSNNIKYCEDLSKIDLQYQDKYWKQTIGNIQSSCNSDNDYSYSNTRSTVSEE